MNTDTVKQWMKEHLEHLEKELRGLRSGRANPSMLDAIPFDVYGSTMTIKSLATVSAGEKRQLIITPFDPSTLPAISKGIEKANIGLQPAVDGNLIRISIPPLTEETRREIVKQAKEKGEKAKISIRDARKKGNEQAKKEKDSGLSTEDELKRSEKEIQKLTDHFCAEVDRLLQEKEKDIMSV